MRKILFFILILAPFATFAASMDSDGDGQSDPTTVVAESSLDWKVNVSGSESNLASNFGALGDHLMPAHYQGKARTDLGIVKDGGAWSLYGASGLQSISFGADNSEYIGGSDFDGDGKHDIAYRTRVCKAKRSSYQVMLDPLGGQSLTGFSSGKGRFFSTYGDINGDGSDEICFLKPQRKRDRSLRGTFLMICKNALNGKRISRLPVRKVFEQPLPVKQYNGQADLFAFPRYFDNRTVVVIRNNKGKRVAKLSFDTAGTVVIGNFTNTAPEPEQIGLYNDSQITVWDLATLNQSKIDAPEGIPVDEINIVNFESNDSCYCTSKTIRANSGSCIESSDSDNDSGGSGNTGIIAGSCDQNRDITDGSGNFLHKPKAENSNSIVNLFPRSDDPSTCWYENSKNSFIGNAYSSGYSNPDRPTFRPTTGSSCGAFPANFIVACNVRGQKHCWQIPSPCNRYD